ncbi:MAG: type III pantothenate kinase [Armatimonadetes bacterium]|nr:type III pantothenate kinase [Armatimonadota bacterium]
MLLALDIGNTNLTAGLWDGADLAAQWRYATRRDATSDELAANFYASFQTGGFSFGDVAGVAISSVVPSLTPQSARFSRDYFGIEPLVVSHELDLGLKNIYDDPRAVGADRLVNGLAAWKKAGGAVVVADFGTATTVDAVSADGTYLGGGIAPGIGISTDALFRAAAKLPRVELVAPTRALARNTAESIQAGLVFGYAGLTKELISRCAADIESDWGQKPAIYATGGLAELIAPLVPQIERVEANLTLEGLKLIWEMRQ